MRKLRLTKKEVCYMLSIKADKLRKLIIEDETFPRPIKDGQNRQSPVYFDLNAIEAWWQSRLENSLNNYV
ncbi:MULTISPECIES: AlpA family transcriptional regulator [Acinetobacter]|uniref:helix-turn-helix transcriptional regulator n=1 Tax=Acinetobacter TaxID=469 RepID=UPI0018FF5885|nr:MULTISPECIES: AlpA family transcriptional regulator [Acinetobacter]MBJ8424246.1 AlpA family transcriptional regulator [Acinetobacter bereziniae]MDH0032751.1 AlpA family transcriptional regulator [Acinetobacter sp. GD04021]MDH0885964.1 AlpA family transcriptional regulator [Acinetobacter sp. GD03873]MDH1082584.1 AlpA family transcriptional regulator [Acinetobacter sp. GD03983]MDH2189621.1 AlpA family transcriptional regulator [Acinetobacter sp. GD03645]